MRAMAVVMGVGFGATGTAVAASSSENSPTPTDSNTVAYTDLSGPARKAFDTAQGSPKPGYFGPSSKYVEQRTFKSSATRDFRGYSYVEKDGQLYEFDLDRVDLLGSYELIASEQDPSPNSTVVSIEDVGPDRRGAVEQAVRTGAFHAAPGRWKTIGEVRDIDLVEVDGKTYEITIVFGDSWLTALTVTPV
jgi:hypothetical protein